MKNYKVPKSNIEVSSVVLGLMRIAKMDNAEIRDLYNTAREVGITVFDHADIYGGERHRCEERFGEAVTLSASEREAVVIQSKVGIRRGWFDFSRDHILKTSTLPATIAPSTASASIDAARRIAHLTYRGEQEIDERFGTTPQSGENPLGPYRSPGQRFAVESYLDYQGVKLVERFDAGSYVILTDSLNRHDVGRGRGGLNKALASTQVPTMIVGVDTDILYPYHQQEHLSRNVGNLLGMAKIVSPVGHDAFLTEFRQMDRILRRFLDLSTAEVAAGEGLGGYSI